MKPILAITLGDINGVGPEVLAKALARPEPWQACQPLVVGDAGALDRARAFAPDCPAPAPVSNAEAAREAEGVPVLAVGPPAPMERPGVIDPAAGACAAAWIEAAVRMAMDGAVDGIVTCPINKHCLHQGGFAYAGHTDFVAALTGTQDYRMSLFAGNMRAVHISSHCSLREALAQVEQGRIETTVRITAEALARLGLARRHIAVAGLNPHAGEEGAFGAEEQRIIAPAVAVCREAGVDCSGPYPPDTVFRRMRQGEFDAVVAMYHDQGHIPLKLVAMEEGVNVTLGIPIVRTSVDHGTAYDIAGKGVASEASLCAAIALAAQLSGAPASAERSSK